MALQVQVGTQSLLFDFEKRLDTRKAARGVRWEEKTLPAQLVPQVLN